MQFILHYILGDDFTFFFFGGGYLLTNNRAANEVSLLHVALNGTVTSENATVTKLPEPRMDHCAVGYSNTVAFVIGGRTSNGALLSSCYMFVASETKFVKVFNLTRPRLDPICNIVGSKIIIAGGYTATPNSRAQT